MTTWFRCKVGVVVAVAAAVAAAGGVLPGVAQAACGPEGLQLIRNLEGRWRGHGTVTPIGGVAERILCRVSYATRSRGEGVVQSIDCAGTDYRIRAESSVMCQDSRLMGVWSENLAHNTGTVHGVIRGRRLNISFKGPNFQGRLAVHFASSRQHSVTILQFDPAKGRYVPIARMSLRR